MKKLSKASFISLFLGLSFLTLSPLYGSQAISVKFGPDYPRWTDGSKSGQKVGFAAGMQYGYDFHDQVEGQVEILYRGAARRHQYDLDRDGEIIAKHQNKMDCMTYLANLIYKVSDVKLYGMTPHFGAGVGWQSNTDKYKFKSMIGQKTIESTRRDTRIALQAIVGFSYPLENEWEATCEYKYLTGKNHVKQHGVHLGLAKRF